MFFSTGEILRLGDFDFEIVSVLGKGADGVVYKAMLGDEEVAIKIMRKNLLSKNEKDILSMLKNDKYVPKYYGYYEYEDHVAIIMEYFNGYSFDKYIDLAGGRLKYKVIWEIVYRMVEGLFYIHSSNVGHCDLSAQNIMIDKDLNVKYIDFSRSCYGEHCEGPTEPVEIGDDVEWVHDSRYDGQYKTFLEYQQKEDIFALGLVIFRLLVGKEYENRIGEVYPGDGDTNYVDARSKDKYLNYLIKKLTEPDLRNRFNAKKALNYLDRIM